MPTLITGLSIIAKPRTVSFFYPSVKEQINKLVWSAYTTEQYWEIKRNELLVYTSQYLSRTIKGLWFYLKCKFKKISLLKFQIMAEGIVLGDSHTQRTVYYSDQQ